MPLASVPPFREGDRHEDLVALQGPLRRFVASRVGDSHVVDDIVQETMLRMLEVAPRLDEEVLGAYSFTVARNLIYGGARSQATARRNLPRMLDRREPVQPEDAATQAESRRALGAALAKVSPSVRAQLLARDVDRRPLHEVAGDSNLTSGVLASQLHRTRAKLRVDYVLALRKVELPTKTCEKVLVAISAADRRRQANLQAGQHLDTCSVCSDLSLPLVSRDHALAGWAPIPLLALGSLHGHLARVACAHPRATNTAAAGAVVAAAVAAAFVVAAPAVSPAQSVSTSATGTAAPASPATDAPAVIPPSQSARTPTTAPVADDAAGANAPPNPVVPDLTRTGGSVIADAAELAPLAGGPVHARGVLVLSVPTDEGFWVGRTDARIWVRLAVSGESAVQIKAGQRLNFSGRITPNNAAFEAGTGLSKDEGQATLNRLRFHIQADPASVQVR